MRSLRLAHRLHQILTITLFLSLMATWTHVHTESEHGAATHGQVTDSGQLSVDAPYPGPALLPDDAHHEHSPNLLSASEPCFVCRTRKDAQKALSLRRDAVPQADVAHHEGEPSPIPCDSTDRRLPGVRAPPPCRA